jgi:hypothetical protein
MQHVRARWFACEADAAAAIAEYEHRGPGQGSAAAGLRPGGIMPYAIASWLTPAARGGRGGDVPPRRTHPRWRRAIASWSRSRD